MSKNPTRRPTSEPTGPQQAAQGLDETITDLTVKTKKGVQQHWKLLVIVIVGVFVGVAILEVIAAVDDNRTRETHGKIFNLTGALRDDQDPDIDAMRALLTELEEDVTEKAALKTVVALLLQRGDQPKPSSSPFGLSVTLQGEEDDPEIEAKKKKFYAAAGEFAQNAAGRFPDDEDIQTWAEKVRARVNGESNQSWLPVKRSYKLKPPGKTSASDAETTGE